MAEDARSQTLTLERVFASPSLQGQLPRALKLSPDGTLLASLRPRGDDRDRLDLWATDTVTGRSRMLVDSLKLGSGAILSEAEMMQRERARIGGAKGIVSYSWAPDGKHLLIPLDGDLFLVDLGGGAQKLSMPRGGLNPTLSPRGGFVSYVSDQNLWVYDIEAGATLRLTADGAGTVHWGEAEFVAQEEMDRRTGHWWSPDDRLLAVERFDEAKVGIVNRAAIGAEGTSVYAQRYPAAGTANAEVALYIIARGGGRPVRVDLGPDADIYLARVDWTPDGKALLVQRQSRDQKTLDLLSVDPATGNAKIILSEKSESWVSLSDSYRALGDGRLIWWSERDGHGHLYLVDAKKTTQLTRGNWEVGSLLGVDEAKQRLFFEGNRDDVLENQVYTLDLRSPNKIDRLTERGFNNFAAMDKAATRLVVQRSSPAQPPQTYLADANGKRLQWIAENAVVEGHPYLPFMAAHVLPTYGTLKADDGTPLHWSMLSPRPQPGKRYPVFFEHYGGPTVQVVQRQWGNPIHQYLVQHGWIVFMLDNRGSSGRGVDFAKTLYRAMGGVEVADQVAGAKWLKLQPYVDPDRIATYGWSYGGYMTVKLLEKAPGVFAAGIAGAPVTKWNLYDTHYTERYLGDPRQVPMVYAASNALDDANTISDPLLLIHGMSDDNVIFENSTALMAKLQGASRPFEMMVYPGQTHRVGGPGISVHVWKTIVEFLDRRVTAKP